MNDDLKLLMDTDKKTIHLSRISSLLNWDMETSLAKGGMNERSSQLSLIRLMIHEQKMNATLQKAIDNLLTDTSLSQDEKKLVNDYHKMLERERKIPLELVLKRAELSSMSRSAWVSARKNSDFKEFLPFLEQIVELVLQESDAVGYAGSPYDVHLDTYEKGLTEKEVDRLFIPLEQEISSIVKTLSVRHKDVDDSFLYGNFPKEKQRELAKFIAKEIGYNFERGTEIYEVVHPFASCSGFNDARITTKYPTDFFNPAFWGVLHESGHAIYRQGLPKKYQYSSLGMPVSMSVNESQSRFYENAIGKGREFLHRYFPKIKETFPEQFANVTPEQFYNAINKVTPSYIRIESDEVSYQLHIILRYKIEKMLLSKTIKVKDVADVWRAEFKSMFGIEVDSDANGVLQDVHWSKANFGYFPTYTLGNLYYAQFLTAMDRDFKAQNTSVANLVSRGDFKTILAWLNKNIHEKGSTVTSQELVKDVTGSVLDSSFFVKYVKNKFEV